MTKQVLDMQQMQHLQELGLELKDTMLYWIKPLDAVIGIVVGLENDWQLDFIDDKKKKYLKYIPAYTLQDVLDALPAEINSGTRRFWLRIDFSDECLYYYYDDYKFVEHRKKVIGYDGMGGLIDAAYELLCWCIDNKFVETNKNE